MRFIKGLILLFFTSPVFAVNHYFGINVGRFNGTQELSSAFVGGGEVGIEFKGTGISAQTFYMQQEVRAGLDPGGCVTLIPLMLQVEGFVPLKRNRVRLGLAVGEVLSDFQISKETERRNEWSNEMQSVGIKNDLAFMFSGGMERKLTEDTSIGFSISYFIYETRLEMARVMKSPELDMPTRYESTVPIKFSSVIGRICLRFR